MPQVRHLGVLPTCHRCIASVACIGAVPRYSSMGSLKFLDQGAILTFAHQVPELLRNVPTNFSYSGHWTLNFLHSNEKFKSQRRGDESGAAVHLSNVTEYNNCFLGLMDAHGEGCHLPGCDTWPVPPHRSACHHRNYGMPCQNRHQSSPLHRL